MLYPLRDIFKKVRATLILSKYLGGFGNRLYLHIHVLAAAMEHGFSVVNLTLHQHARFFECLWANSLCRFPPPILGLPLHSLARALRGPAENLARWQGRHPGSWPGLGVWTLPDDQFQSMEDPGFLAACRRHRWMNLQGWEFRANRYVQRHQEAIRNFMRFRRSRNPRLTALLDESKARGKTRVCLHIRAGDFRTWQGGRHFIEPAEYARAAHQIARTETGRDLEFWVSSDEPVDLSLFPPGSRTTPNRTLAEDFQLMTESEFILGGKSTLSRVAAYLGHSRIHFYEPDTGVPLFDQWTSGSGALEERPPFSGHGVS